MGKRMSRIVIFGAGKFADVIFYHFRNDSPHEVVAFTADGADLTTKEKFGCPVVPFEDLQDKYRPEDFKMFVAVGYQHLNKFRAQKCVEAKAKGYELVNYISSRASNIARIAVGENSLVLDHAVIQPCAKVGSNVFLWNGNHLGHHSTIEDHCFIAGNVVISGTTRIEPYCFIGVNATIGHEITVGRESFIGAGTIVTKDVESKSVYIAADTPKYRLDSLNFLRLTKMK
jgi:sugar O-acyltransferase (sialic acid O-acetyltransferase NeuD family)